MLREASGDNFDPIPLPFPLGGVDGRASDNVHHSNADLRAVCASRPIQVIRLADDTMHAMQGDAGFYCICDKMKKEDQSMKLEFSGRTLAKCLEILEIQEKAEELALQRVSREVVRSQLPLWFQEQEVTVWLWPRRSAPRLWPLRGSHSLTKVSLEPEAIMDMRGCQSAHRMSPPWPIRVCSALSFRRSCVSHICPVPTVISSGL